MKLLKKSLITTSCAVALMASMSITASARGFETIVIGPNGPVDTSGWTGTLPNGGGLSDILGQLPNGSSLSDILGQLPNGGSLSDILGQLPNGGSLSDILGQLPNGACGLPAQDCPGNRPNSSCPGLPGTPEFPEYPEFPAWPENPSEPTPPVTPPTWPDTPVPPVTPPTQPDVPTPPVTGEPDSSVQAYVQEIARLVNEERAKAGLAALTVNTQVQSAAQVRAQEQVSSFSHTRPDGTSCFTALAQAGVSYRSAGENIAYGQRTPAEVMTGWMNSSGHRANILGSFTQIGVGCYQDASGTLYWTQMFIA